MQSLPANKVKLYEIFVDLMCGVCWLSLKWRSDVLR
jgi:hypothetical protein